MKNNLYKDDFWILAKSFLNEHLIIRRRYSLKTKETYKLSIEVWLAFLKDKHNLEKYNVTFNCFSKANLDEFVKWMETEKAYKSSTINLRITSLASFLEYASNEENDLIPYHQVISKIIRPTLSKNPIQYLESDAMNAILSAIPADTKINRRDRIIIVMIYEVGCRAGELPALTLRSLHLDDVEVPYITVIGKGNYPRNVPLSKKAVAHLREYIKEFHRYKTNQPLFYSRKNGKNMPLSTDTYQNVLKKAADLGRKKGCTSIPADISIHLIRKTRAMDLYRKGMDLYTIAQFLGHKNVNTTNGFYAFASFDMIADALKKMESSNDSTNLEKKWKNSNMIDELLYTLD